MILLIASIDGDLEHLELLLKQDLFETPQTAAIHTHTHTHAVHLNFDLSYPPPPQPPE